MINTNNQLKLSDAQRASLIRAEKAQAERNFQLAEQEYRKLIAQKVNLPQVYSQLALICAMTQRNSEAKQFWNFTLKLSPNYIGALMGLADVYKFERNFQKAIGYYQRGISINPNISAAYLSLSFSHIQLGEIDLGEKACRKALQIDPNLYSAQDYLGQIYVLKGELTKALSMFEGLLKQQPNNVSALYAIGNIRKSEGKFKEALDIYRKIFKVQPQYTQAHFTYSSIYKYKDETDEHILLMLELYNTPNIPVANKIHLAFSLAKAFEDIGYFDKSFSFLKVGNKLRFDQFNYDIESDKALIHSIIDVFNADVIGSSEVRADESKVPIFIVGMPRSGTSLVEKVLATHSEVYGAGELDYFFQLGTRGLLTESTNYLYKPLSTYNNEHLNCIAKTYLDKIKTLSPDAKHITDKLPFNMLLIGLIKLVLPNAKIIHCAREPIDNCLSIYKRNFTTDNYRFAYDLKALAKFHKLYEKLMEHWHKTFPDSIYDVQYEALTQNPEVEIRKLIEYCGVEWQDECLKFDKSKAIVTTASAYQVRQPMYTSSVGVWERYKEHLSPLIEELNKS